MPKSRPLCDRFWENVLKSEGCWEWQGTMRPQGYGSICEGPHGGHNLSAHRVSWEIHNGPIPDGMCILHKCDNPKCVHPDHLFLGTLADNNRDREMKGRGAQVRGEAHYACKLSDANVKEIRKQYQSYGPGIKWAGKSDNPASLAKKYGVCVRTIHDIVEGRRR